jgi:O-antigen/teichoic acid export membrane protein
LFLGVYYNLSIWYKLTGKTMWGALITIIGAVITIGLNIILIPLSSNYLLHGYLGSAYATLACYTVMMMLGYLIGQRFYPIDYNLKKFFGYLGLSLSLYLLSDWIKPESLLWSIPLNILLLSLFLGVVWKVERLRFSKISQ